MAVELLVTLLHHPHGHAAAADLDGSADGGAAAAASSPLGSVPHQLRVSLPRFRTDAMVGQAFNKCTACSSVIVDAYKARGFEFLLSAFNRATYLEDFTGLSEMHAQAEAAMQEVCAFDSDEEDDE